MMTSLLSRLRLDERGVSAVEFALLAPVLIAIYMGLSEFCQGYMAQKRMGHVTSMVADLVAQEEAVSGTNLDEIFAIGGLIMKPFPTTPLQQRVSATEAAGATLSGSWSVCSSRSSPSRPRASSRPAPSVGSKSSGWAESGT